MANSCRLLLAVVLLLLAAPALAAPCGGDFNAFLAGIARDAQGQGVSRAVIDQAFAGLTPDPAVLARPAASVLPARNQLLARLSELSERDCSAAQSTSAKDLGLRNASR